MKATAAFTLLDASLANTVDFELLDRPLGRDVQATLRIALKSGVVFPVGTTPLAIFRDSVRQAIGRIQEDGRAKLLVRFLKDGPYEDAGKIPKQFRDQRLSDDETAAVTGFIHSHMVNSFKGTLTELLAVGPVLRLLHEFQSDGRLPRDARLHVGDTVWSSVGKTRVFAKGADMHVLVVPRSASHSSAPGLAGVVEVKSYFKTAERLRRQLAQHVARARRGLRFGGADYFPPQLAPAVSDLPPVRISVIPAAWPLPRGFRFETTKEGRKFLHVDPPIPPAAADHVAGIGDRTWHVTLRWSKEALDAAAYGMTFWFMEKLGEALYTGAVPPEWSEMTPAQAGQNAAKQMLYYAIMRARNRRDEQRAIAIYNSYGFGCALGMNFRNKDGRREMLWPEDLEEIAVAGRNKHGSRIV